MRVLLACVAISLCVLAANAALTCFGDNEKCAPEECCIQVGNTLAGICRKRHEVDEVCEIKPLKNLFKDHVYKIRCPCAEGLKCESSKGGLLGKLAGKCQQESGEEQE